MAEHNASKRPLPPAINDSSMVRESWKLFQVISEFVEGYERLVHIRPSVSLFGSARIKPGTPFFKLAYDVALLLSNANYTITTGGGPGLMEAGNRGAYAGKSLSIGLNIELVNQEPKNDFQDISLSFRHFFTRKIMFVKYACAYVVMPGGFGTLDELAEILALIQTGKTKKIPVVLVHEPFWKPLITWFTEQMLAEGLISEADFSLFSVVNTPKEVLSTIEAFYRENPKFWEQGPPTIL